MECYQIDSSLRKINNKEHATYFNNHFTNYETNPKIIIGGYQKVFSSKNKRNMDAIKVKNLSKEYRLEVISARTLLKKLLMA